MSKTQFAFYDSGTGGIPYMLHLKKKQPNAHCLYFGDTLHFPYGTKSTEEIIDCAFQTVELILKTCDPEVIVLACNTISITALDALRAHFSVPFIGTVPAIKPASEVSKNRRIGLLATECTVNSGYTQNLIKKFASDCVIVHRGDSELISYIEQNLFSATSNEKKRACEPSIDFFKSKDVDTIILGCTHFLHLTQEFKELCSSSINVVDSQEGVVRQALKVASATSSISNSLSFPDTFNQQVPDLGLFITGTQDSFHQEQYEKLCAFLNIPFLGLIEA